MFLCEKCHSDCGCFTIMKSYGKCEDCGGGHMCIDCQAHHQPPPKSDKRHILNGIEIKRRLPHGRGFLRLVKG